MCSIIKVIGGYIGEPIKREYGYLCFMTDNMERLRNQVELLEATRETVQQRVDEAKGKAEDILSNVLYWCTKVDCIIEESRVILVREGQQVGLCQNLVQRRWLSKEAERKADEAANETTAGNFSRVSFENFSTIESEMLLGFMNFESRNLIMKQIMDALEDDSINMIGVYGMGGIGKTMLVNKISRQLKAKKSFDEVITSTVSQTPDLRRIQEQLGAPLSLKLKDETVERSALKLHKRLKMEERILVVLDDIWENIDLEKIGIPSSVSHKGCKIIFTSRDKHTLSNEMCINTNFEIKVLKKYESWNLLKTIVGEVVEADDLKPIVDQIVKECAHLPIAITTVAKALRNKPSPIWKDALDQLKNPVTMNIRGMNKKVYSSIKLSYEYLECEELKLLFLFCSMFPEDFLIRVEDLHVYAMSMGFLNGFRTVAQGRRRITKLIDDLISSSLLLQSEFKDSHVKMHDIVRDVAILIASNHDQIRTLSYVKRLNEWEEEKMSDNYTAVYLDVKDLHSPLQKLMLPEVQLLILHGPLSEENELAENIFKETKELKGLELKSIKVSLTRPSLYSFANVRLLHLVDCELGNIDMIGELKKLEILNFTGSNIIQIPMAISQLTQLKVLDLSSCNQLKVIPPDILSKLTNLEELYLETFSRWEGEELNKERKNASLSELRYLPNLSTLSLSIQHEKIIPKQLFSRELKLEKFNISIGSKLRVYDWNRFSRMLCLEMVSGSCLDGWIKRLLRRCEELELVGSSVARVLQFELDENDSYSHLKSLHLYNDSEFPHFIHQQNKPLRKILSNLEYLELSRLKNLESIIHGHVRELPLNKLTRVQVVDCGKLGTLFYNCMLDDILNLKEIFIFYCKMLEVITAMESKERSATIEFTNLNSLYLRDVPRIRSFCSKIEQIGQSSLDNSEKVETSKISNRSPFFSEEVLLPNLEILKIRGADNLEMIWHNVLIPNSFSKLETVGIESCNNLENVFPSNIVSILTCLKFLTIKKCSLLKCIFEVQELDEIEKSKVLLSNLRRLELFKLPNLEYVWRKSASELLIFENIKVLSIQQCPKLKRAYPIKVLQQLVDLQIDLSRLKETLSVRMLDSNQFETSEAKTTQMQDGLKLFSKLKSLKLSGSLDYNSSHLPIEVERIVHNLERFEVRRMLVKEIFPNQKLINVEEHQNTRFEPSYLSLFKLPKLTHFWKDDYKSTSSLKNLASLIISGCGILDMLVPSSVSFRNLSRLELDKCHRLTHLLNPWVARTLVHLKRLVLKSCKRMTTIIAEVVEEGNEEIVFNRLEYLLLMDLSKLTSFHSGKCILRFPYLDHVTITTCSKMKDFSLGIISTSNLLVRNVDIYPRYRYEDYSNYGYGDSNVEDINDIIRQAWEDINGNDNYDTGIQYLFTEKNLEENESDHSSSCCVEE